MRRIAGLMMVAVLGCWPLGVGAAELRAGFGVFLVAPHGVDLSSSVWPVGQRWSYGLRYLRWLDTFTDPFSGTDLTETTETRAGLTFDYLFEPDAPASWYLSAALYRATRSEHSLVTAETETDAVTSPYVGGGYTANLGDRFYYDIGLLVSPGAELKTSTSVSSEESSASFEAQLILGMRF